MIRSISVHAYRRFVQQYASRFTMERLIADKTMFKTYKMCRYATDVTFQQTFRPGGTLAESKKYFSGKHKLYGFKVEASVLPNGMALHVSKHYLGSVADMVTMRQMLHVHDSELEKSDIEKTITDIGPSSDQSSGYWGVLLDKGYTGIEVEVRCVIPKKKPVVVF